MYFNLANFKLSKKKTNIDTHLIMQNFTVTASKLNFIQYLFLLHYLNQILISFKQIKNTIEALDIVHVVILSFI